jgi:flagellar biosynthesis protein FlhG
MTACGEARMIAVLSGKGGVGKTNLVANVAVAAAGLGAKVLVVDGDLGLANVDLLLGLTAPRTVSDVLTGECALEDALLSGPRGIHLLPAASGRSDLTSLRPAGLARLLVPLYQVAPRYDLVLADLGAGVGVSVIGLAAACDRAILVTTPEPTSLADAYATLKVLCGEAPTLPVGVFVNAVRDEIEARDTHARLERVARRFLHRSPPFLGFVPRDRRLVEAVQLQQAVVEAFPTAASSRGLVRLAARLLREGRRRASDLSPSVGGTP